MNTSLDPNKIRKDPHACDETIPRQEVDYLFEPFVLPAQQDFNELTDSEADEEDLQSDSTEKTAQDASTQPHYPQNSLELIQSNLSPFQQVPNLSPTTTLIHPAIEKQCESYIDPLIRRIFILTIVKIESGEPTPIISTFTWSFSTQYRTFVRILTKLLEISRTRHDDPFDVFDEDEEIVEDLTKLSDFEPTTYGVNNYNETIPSEQFLSLFSLHQRVCKYYKMNNNIHSGMYHSFTLSRHIINDSDKKTYTRDLTNLQSATQHDIERFFQP